MDTNILDEMDMQHLGQLLQEARKILNMTQEQAAEAINVARTTMVAIEKGERRIKASELIKLAEVYGRPLSDFIRPRPKYEPFIVQFRGLYGSKRSDGDDEKIAKYISSLEDVSRQYLELEQITNSGSIAKYPTEYSIQGLSPDQAGESVASAERNRLGLGDGPIQMLRNILEQTVGLRIFYLPLEPSTFSEIYFYNDTLGGCIAINTKHPPERDRWSLSHAYGHFLMHRHKPSAMTNYDKVPLSERFADRFAAYFLMPSSSVRREFYNTLGAKKKLSQADLLTLANYFGVSFQAFTLRLESMNLIPSGTSKKLQRRGVKVREAQQELGLSPVVIHHQKLPIRYQYLAVQAFQEQAITESELADYLHVDLVHARRIVEILSEDMSIASAQAEQIDL